MALDTLKANSQEMVKTIKENDSLLTSLKAKLAKKEGEVHKEKKHSGSSDGFKVSKVMEIEKNLAYRSRHLKTKGNRSYPSPLTTPSTSSKKARAARWRNEELPSGQELKKKVPVHCFLAQRLKGCCYFCSKVGHKARNCPSRSK